ncbi:MAG: glycosyltransferase [Candidatus Gracilibacteria bacterium]|nr:glycosyltransferase [Candidatus Gracilibacteria bacterium]
MKIGLDLRTINTNTYYFKFIYEFLSNLKDESKENKFIIYTSSLNFYNFIELSNFLDIKKVNTIAGSFSDQFAGNKYFNEENLDALIFFSYKRPYFYKKRNLIFLENLKELLYPNYKSSFKKYFDLIIMKLSFGKTDKILGFSNEIISGLNEKLNIEENKIALINPFFIKSRKNEDFIDIRMKYNITNDYIIYPGTYASNKNINRLFEAFSRIIKDDNKNIDLVFTDKNIGNIIEVRELILRNGLQNKVKFLPDIKEEDLYFYYFESIGVIYPSLYESFPFELSDAINFEKPIIASKIDNIKSVFGDLIEYFLPMSIGEIKNNILNLKNKDSKNNYNEIIKKYNPTNFINNLIKEITNF